MPNPLSEEEQKIFNAIGEIQENLHSAQRNLEGKKKDLDETLETLKWRQKWHDDIVASIQKYETALAENKAKLQKLWNQPTLVPLAISNGKSKLESDSIASLESRSEHGGTSSS